MWAPHNHRWQKSTVWPVHELSNKQAAVLDRKNSARRSTLEINIILPYPYLQRRELPPGWFPRSARFKRLHKSNSWRLSRKNSVLRSRRIRNEKYPSPLPHDSIRQPSRRMGTVFESKMDKPGRRANGLHNGRRFTTRWCSLHRRILHQKNDQQRRSAPGRKGTRVLPDVEKTTTRQSRYGSHPRTLYYEIWRVGHC